MLSFNGSARVLCAPVVVTVADLPAVPLCSDNGQMNMAVVVPGRLPRAPLKPHSVHVAFCHLPPLFIREPAIFFRKVQRHTVNRLRHSWRDLFTVRVHRARTLTPGLAGNIPGHLVRIAVLVAPARSMVICQATCSARTLGDIGDHGSRPGVSIEAQQRHCFRTEAVELCR